MNKKQQKQPQHHTVNNSRKMINRPFQTKKKKKTTVCMNSIVDWITHLASKTKAMVPAAIGQAADVPWNVSVHEFPISAVAWKDTCIKVHIEENW